MPISEFQNELLTLLAQNRTEESFVAGATALLDHPATKRFSNDIDYFHDREQLVQGSFEKDKRLLSEHGYSLDVIFNSPGYIRATVGKDQSLTKVEWAVDSSWRFMPIIKDDHMGYALHPVDAATNKILALVGRDEPRDVVDVLHCHAHVLCLGALIWAACGKDPGLSPNFILTMIRRRGRLRQEDLDELFLAEDISLQALKSTWLDALDDAENYINGRPAEELGCLYFDPASKKFVDPRSCPGALPHFGQPGGVWPKVIEQ